MIRYDACADRIKPIKKHYYIQLYGGSHSFRKLFYTLLQFMIFVRFITLPYCTIRSGELQTQNILFPKLQYMLNSYFMLMMQTSSLPQIQLKKSVTHV